MSSGWDVEEDSLPRASGVIEDLLLVVGYIVSIQEVVIPERVLFVGTGSEACSHLEEEGVWHCGGKDSKLLDTSLRAPLPHQDYLLILSRG